MRRSAPSVIQLLAAALLSTPSTGIPLAAQSPCPTPDTITITSLLRTESRLAPSDSRLPDGGAAMAELACARWQLWQLGAIARERPGMPLGSSWLDGAAAAAWTGLTSPTPTDDIAAMAAALASAEPIRLTTAHRFDAIVAARDRAGWSEAALRSLDRACILLGERLPTRAPDALTCAQHGRSLEPGNGVWWLAESRFLALMGRSSDAWQAWVAGLFRLHTEQDWQPIIEEIRWFASPSELEAIRSAPLARRALAVQALFDQRDLAMGRPQGTYLATHVARVAHARQEFGIRIPRGQEARFTTGAPTSGRSGGTLSDSGDQGDADWRELVRWQSEIDDRGVMYIRHGTPDVRVAPVVPGRALELWAYLRTDPPLMFQFEEEDFDGSAAATRLTAGRWGEQWCGLDVLRCVLGMRGDAPPEQRESLRQQDRQILAAALATDTPGDSSDALPRLAAQAHRLWDPSSGDPILLVAYVLPWPDSLMDRPLQARLRVSSWGGRAQDTTLDRAHPIPSTRTPGRAVHAVGFLTTARDSLSTAWRVEARTGTAVRRAVGSGVRIDPHDGITVSDIIIGSEESPLRWSMSGERIPVDPVATFTSEHPLSLFYQVKLDGVDREVTTRVAVSRIDDLGRTGEEALSLGFTSVVHEGIRGVAPLLDVGRLSPGRYALEIRLTGADGTILGSSWTALRLVASNGRMEP